MATSAIPAPAAAPAPAPAPAPAAAPVSAPAPASTPSPSSGGNLDNVSDESFWSGLESIMQDGGTPPTEGEEPAPPDSAPVEGDQPVADEEPAVDEPAGEQTPASQPADEDPFVNDSIAPIAQDAEKATFRKAHADALMRALDFQQLIERQIPGATPEMLAKHHETQVMMTQMLRDLDSGDPGSVQHVANLILQSPNKATPGVLASQLMEVLPRTNPEAYSAISKQMLKSEVDRLYQEAFQSTDPDALVLAQRMDYRVNGTYRTRENFQPVDPREQEIQQLRAQLDQRQQVDQRQAQGQRQQWLTETDGAVDTAVNSAIEEALAPVAALKNVDGGKDYNHIKRDLYEAVQQAYETNAVFKRKYQGDRTVAYQQATPQARESLIAQMKTFAESVIRAKRREVVEPYYRRMKSQSRGAQQPAASPTQGRGAVNGSAVPASPVPGRKSGGTFEDMFTAVLDESTTPVRRRG